MTRSIWRWRTFSSQRAPPDGPDAMKVLFSAVHFGYFRNFESVVASLAERGHQVHLAADEPESVGGRALVERLAARYSGVTFGFAPSLDDEPWFKLARKLRTASDYVRFHDEE